MDLLKPTQAGYEKMEHVFVGAREVNIEMANLPLDSAKTPVLVRIDLSAKMKRSGLSH
jgi:hypothetical protein